MQQLQLNEVQQEWGLRLEEEETYKDKSRFMDCPQQSLVGLVLNGPCGSVEGIKLIEWVEASHKHEMLKEC